MNKRKIILIIAVIIISILLNGNLSLASFADYDDNTAAQETRNLLLEQEKEEENSIGKSTNNYLSGLEVKGYKITPEFDKQTLSYSISEEINEASIEINATADDKRATVQGTGVIELQQGENNLRIDVKSESGTVRTYFIKVVTTSAGNANDNNESSNLNEEIIDISANIITNDKEQTGEKNELTKYIIIGVAILVIVIFILITLKNGKSKKKSKHN